MCLGACVHVVYVLYAFVCVCILVFPDLLVYYLRAILPYIFPLDYVYTDNSRFFFSTRFNSSRRAFGVTMFSALYLLVTGCVEVERL